MRNVIWCAAIAISGTAILACDKRDDSRPSDEPPVVGVPSVVATPTNRAQPRAIESVIAPAQPAPPATGTAKAVKPKVLADEVDSDMKQVLAELDALGGKPIATLTAKQARLQPTPTDAVKSWLQKNAKSIEPLEVAKVENRKIPGAAGKLDARIYTPKVDAKAPLPVIGYWHGGGFAIADLDVYDASPRALAQEAEAIVVSFDYRRAPEHKFPAAHDDAFAEYQWLVQNASSIGGDPKRIAVAGESAGGNLAINVAIAARDAGKQLPVHQLLVYPVASSDTNSESYQEWANAKPLDKTMMGWFVSNYVRTPADTQDPRINVVAATLNGLPPTTIILAEIDPLRSDGELLGEKLDAAGVDVKVKTYEGVTHEFFGMGAAVSDAKDAQEFAGERLEDAFEKAATE